MTVGELIFKLQNYNDNTRVVLPCMYHGYDDVHYICEKSLTINSNKDANLLNGPHERADDGMGVPCVVIW